MKRSEINAAIKRAAKLFEDNKFALPEWTKWTAEDWKSKGHECDEIRNNVLGWDITDFGKGNFDKEGLTLITIRNGNVKLDRKCYCEKIMLVGDGQITPLHFHWNKMEDIINRGGGKLCMQLWKANKEEEKTDEVFTMKFDGVEREVHPGEIVKLEVGQSVTYEPYIYHTFWGEGDCMVGEVSMVNDDSADNRFFEPLGRYPEIQEDEPKFRLLCNEYPEAE